MTIMEKHYVLIDAEKILHTPSSLRFGLICSLNTSPTFSFLLQWTEPNVETLMGTTEKKKKMSVEKLCSVCAQPKKKCFQEDPLLFIYLFVCLFQSQTSLF